MEECRELGEQDSIFISILVFIASLRGVGRDGGGASFMTSSNGMGLVGYESAVVCLCLVCV